MTSADSLNTQSKRDVGKALAIVAPAAVGIVALIALPAAYGAGVACVAMLTATVLVLLASRGQRHELAGDLYALEAQLNYCRRREESADVVVIEAKRGKGVDVTAIAGALRCTDAVAILEDGKRLRVAAALHRHQLDRDGLEQRMAGEVRAPLSIGWASFPEDGWTVDTLTEHAQEMIDASKRASKPSRLHLLAGEPGGVHGEPLGGARGEGAVA
jgi:hypothetical protein